MKKKVNAKDLIQKIEKLAKERMSEEKVVSLSEFRDLKAKTEPPCILIIEDDETMRRALQRIFEDEGYAVVTAADGTQLSVIFESTTVDLIILDVGLPWINGYELAQLMKEHEDLREIPLVFVSGRSSEVDIKRGFEVGADDYIAKPFEIETIKKSINTLMRLHRAPSTNG